MNRDIVNPMPPSAPAPHNCRHEYASGFTATPVRTASHAAEHDPDRAFRGPAPAMIAHDQSSVSLEDSGDQATPAFASAKIGSTT